MQKLADDIAHDFDEYFTTNENDNGYQKKYDDAISYIKKKCAKKLNSKLHKKN